jgi:hypothetical protein
VRHHFASLCAEKNFQITSLASICCVVSPSCVVDLDLDVGAGAVEGDAFDALDQAAATSDHAATNAIPVPMTRGLIVAPLGVDPAGA